MKPVARNAPAGRTPVGEAAPALSATTGIFSPEPIFETSERGGKVFADFKPGFTDGIRCDTDGNVWCGWGWGGIETNGVRVHAPNGDLLAFLHTPEVVANLCFGGTKRNRLFMTGSTSIYALYVNAVGAALS
jgi:gluconolactonase